jgi:hypothetical protein
MTAAMNRREFLSASAAGAGAVLIGRQLVMAGENADWPSAHKTTAAKMPLLIKERQNVRLDTPLLKTV